MYEKYKKLRDSVGLTDYSVAIGAGITESTFYSWLQRIKDGKEDSKLSFDNLVKLAKFFNVSTDYFA